MQIAVTKSIMASSSMRMKMNPRWFRSIILPWHKDVDSRYRVEEWGPFLLAWRMVATDNYVPTSNGKPLTV